MKKQISIFIFFILSISLFAQPVIQWQNSFGGTGNEYASCIVQTNDGGYIVSGLSASNDSDVTGNNGMRDFWIVKMTNAGSIQWQKSLGGSADDWANCILQTNDGGYIIAGYTESNDSDVTVNHGHRDIWIVKTDSVGSIQWQKSYGGSDFEIAYSIQQTTDGGYIVGGYSNSTDGDLAGTFASAQNFWLIKLNNTGTIQWHQVFGGSFTDEAVSVQQTSDHGYVLAGYTYSSNGHVTGYHGNQDAWVVKTDSTGALQWQKTLGGTANESAGSVVQAADGGFVVACATSSNDDDVSGNHGGSDRWIVKLDTTGTIEWQKTFGGTGNEGASSIQSTSDGGFVIAGSTTSFDGDVTGNHGDYDFWLIKINDSGILQWEKSLGGTGTDGAISMLQTNDEGFIVAGTSNSIDGDVTGNNGNSDYWIVKLDSAQHVNVAERDNATTDFQIYPNPFSNETIVSFNLIASENAVVEIRNVDGRAIKKIFSGKIRTGFTEFVWDATNSSGKKVDAGIYFVTIISDNYCYSKKAVYIEY